MINATLTTEQKELVKNWKEGFKACACDEGIKYTYEEGISAETYCAFMRLDYRTLRRLGDITYCIVYNCVEDKYILRCETCINSCIDGRLSTEFVESEDYLGLYGECMGDKKLDLLDKSADELRDYLRRNYKAYAELEKHIQDDVDDEEIAKAWIHENYHSAFWFAVAELNDWDKKEKIMSMIEDLYGSIKKYEQIRERKD